MNDFDPAQINQKEYQTVILAALLHDIVAIFKRINGEYDVKTETSPENFISSINNFFGDDYAKGIASLINSMYKSPSTQNEHIIFIADKLATAGHYKRDSSHTNLYEANLMAVTSRIRFRKDHGKEMYYNPASLKISREVLFPVDKPSSIERGVYRSLLDKFIKKINSLNTYKPSDFTTLYFILKEFGAFIPSATSWEDKAYNNTAHDVSCFDHSKIVCAIAACLEHLPEEEFYKNEIHDLSQALQQHYEEEDYDKRKEILTNSNIFHKPLFLFLRADIAGIQRFIYNITAPKGDTKGTSKRLRGRSFYISLLTDVISDWLLRKIDLPITNILFCGGGRFDLLLPVTRSVIQCISQVRNEIETWLLEEFKGELSVQISLIQITPVDFFDFGQIYMHAEDGLFEDKARKFKTMISRPGFFKSTEQVDDICSSCLIIPVPRGEICEQCHIQREIGRCLPKKDFLSFVYGKYDELPGIPIPFERFGVTVLLQEESEIKESIGKCNDYESRFFSINPRFKEGSGLDFIRENRPKKPVSFGFKHFGNSAPLALKDCQIIPSNDATKRDEVLEFDEIAALSSGAKYLGILKMDVDYLGSIFSMGMDQASISKISGLSSSFEIFFNGWLNNICEEVTEEWNRNLPEDDKKKGLVKSLFYIVYSGGDDLFIIGPWDKIIDLAKRIYDDFREYTCQNPNITLSAGILFVKPHFPVHRFSQLVNERLEQSKQDADSKSELDLKEKNRVTLFGETVKWVDGIQDPSFDKLMTFAQYLNDLVENREGPLPKGFVYFLGKLNEHFYKEGNLMWVPHLFYSLARRVNRYETREELRSKIPSMMAKIKIPVSYVSLKTRKE